MYNDFVTPEILATFTGLVAATSIIVQFTKFIIKKQFGDSFVRFYIFIIALILTFIFGRTNQGIEGIVITIINAVLITMTAMGGYEMIADPKAEKTKINKTMQTKIELRNESLAILYFQIRNIMVILKLPRIIKQIFR